MSKKIWTVAAAGAALVALVLAGAALAASGHSVAKKTTHTTTAGTLPPRTPETPLTGDVLAKVTAAAVAKFGGTVDLATSENDSSNAAAVYEAHVTKADGTHVTVILDKDYNVLTVEAGHGPGGPGRPGGPGGPGGPGHGPHGGPGGPGGSGETPLTGDIATKAKAAAVASAGGTADFATTENDSSNTAALYEVHVTKADGSHVTVILDKDFTVLATETHPGH